MRAQWIGAGVLVWAACGAEPGPAAPEPSAPPAATSPAGLAPTVVVVLELHAVEGEERRLVELRGLVAAQLEVGLADLPGVVPMVGNVPISPGLSGRLESEAERWRLNVRVDQPDRETSVIAVELCRTSTPCAALAETVGDDPTPGTAALLVKLAQALGREAPREPLWARSPSADRYARLLVGRSAAVWYRLLPPVPAEHLHDRRFDPVERAIFIDPRMSLAHWIAGRRRFEARDFAGARSAFSRAGLAAPERILHMAEEAAALEALGQDEAAGAAWSALAARAPGDARFVLPRVRVLLAMDKPREASATLDALGPRFQGDPRVLALRVAIAERAGGRPEDVALLERWQAADPTSPEPVRRRIALLVARPALDEAYALLPELERRGAGAEVAQLRLALATSLGRLDEAIAAAQVLELEAVVTALSLRRGLERGDPLSELERWATEPLGRVALGERALGAGDAARALRYADGVLVTEAWMPEALALRARALDALGRGPDAAETWARARAADPALEGLPARVSTTTRAAP